MLYRYIYLKEMLREPAGQGMTEYAVILGLVLVATVGVVTLLGNDVQGLYDNINQGMDSSFEANTFFSG